MKMDIYEILKKVPHRFPFLMIDKIVEVVPEEYLIAQKNVTFNEPHFTGHFPENPVMPGVLIVEAMAQAMALLGYATMDSRKIDKKENETFLLCGMDKVRVKKPVIPGDILMIRAEMGKNKGGIWTANAEVTVEGEVVCSANLLAAYRDISK